MPVEALQQQMAKINGREALPQPMGTSDRIPGRGGVKHGASGRRMNGGKHLPRGSRPLEVALGLWAPHPALWHPAAAPAQVLLALRPAAPAPVLQALQSVAPARLLLAGALPGPRCAADTRTPRRSPSRSHGLGPSPDVQRQAQGEGSNQAIAALRP